MKQFVYFRFTNLTFSFLSVSFQVCLDELMTRRLEKFVSLVHQDQV